MLDNLSFGKAYSAAQSNKAENIIFYFIQLLCLCIFASVFPFSFIKKTPGEKFSELAIKFSGLKIFFMLLKCIKVSGKFCSTSFIKIPLAVPYIAKLFKL
jgi:hypothetical protein